MADNVGYTPGTGANIAADDIGGILHQRVKIGVGVDGSATDVSSSNPMPVTGTVTANTGLTQPLTDAQLRAAAVPVSGTFFQATQPVSIAASVPVTGPATDAQLRATPLPISGTVTANTGLSQPLTDAQLRASAVPVSGPLTDTQLRATAVQIQGTVSGTAVPVSGTFFQATQPVSIAASVAVTGPLTDAQLRAADVPVTGTVTANTPSTGAIGFPVLAQATQVGGSDGTNLRILKTDSNGELQVDIVSSALPSGAATETTLTAVEVDTTAIATSTSGINGKLAALSTRVLDNEASGAPVRAIGQEIWNVSFSEVGASVISNQFVTPQTGTGVSYSQASGSLAIVAGTTTNAEFFTRSTTAWRGAMRLKFSIIASQRIVNNNLAVMLADLVGDNLNITINSATSITIAQSGHTFTSTSVGQFVQVGRIVGAAGVPGRYAIASVVAGVSYNLTVAGWPASGTCTATIFGHSYVRNLVTGTTATTINVDAQRRGWAQGDTAATINTTASPGTVITSELTGREVFWADQLRASTTSPTVVVRANRVEYIPDDNLDLYLFVWSFNGTTAPASSTTWTMSFCAIEKFANMPVYIQGLRANGAMNPLPVAVNGSPVLGAGTSAIGDVGIQYRATNTGAATSLAVQSPATPAATTIKATAGRLIGYYLQNSSTGIRSVKVFNVVAGSVVLGTTSAAFAIDLPANGIAQLHFEGGIAFSTAMTYSVSSAKGLTDNTATGLAANDVSGFFAFA